MFETGKDYLSPKLRHNMIVKRKDITHIRPFLNISESFEQEYELAVGVYHLVPKNLLY